MNVIRVGVDTPRFDPNPARNGALSPKRRAILKAMLHAVTITGPGTLIIQEDVEIPELDMRLLDATARHIEPGTIWCLNPPRSKGHTCPQAFIVSDEATRMRLVDAWSRPEIQTCLSWAEIPKSYPPIRGTHAGRPWR